MLFAKAEGKLGAPLAQDPLLLLLLVRLLLLLPAGRRKGSTK